MSRFHRNLSFNVPASRRDGLSPAGIFVLGLIGGALIGVAVGQIYFKPAAPLLPADRDTQLRSGSSALGRYPVDVLRVIDGDTFEARVHVWPGFDLTTRVRLRGIDAPELKARCEDERARAEAAREALRNILSERDVSIWSVGPDKYFGRIVAEVSTRRTAEVSTAMLSRRLKSADENWRLAHHHNRRANADAAKQIEDVGIVHADAAIGHEPAD